MNQIPWEHIQDKLRNPSLAEDETLRNWLIEDVENETFLGDLKVIFSITGSVPDSFEPQKEMAWQRIVNRISIKKRRFDVVGMMLRVAASILLIALGIGGGFFLKNSKNVNSFTEVYSPYGHKTMVLLPDSSQVWLNGGTRIKYCTDFAKSRNVELTGEALFHVTKNPSCLFTVKSKDLRIEVYGTTFNVHGYENDLVSEISLVEGSVSLFRDEQLVKKMLPGEVITYDANSNKFNSYKGNIKQITSWRSDELIVQDETFANMVKYLERWYGVEITLDKSLNQNLRLSFKVKTESFIELLSIINHITPISYEINGKEVKITKRKPSKN
jgi:ferric-dicitrate binding protein FerR (iron transport regulator)